MKTLIYSTLLVAAFAGAGHAIAQDAGNAGAAGPAYGPAVGTPEYYNNSGYPPADAREQIRRERRLDETRRLQHERELATGDRRERREQARRLEHERQLAENERREREFLAAQRRDAERARLANSRERDRFGSERDSFGTRQRDRDGDGVSNRRDRFPDDPSRS